MIKYLDICKETNRLQIRPLNMDDYKTWLEGFNGQAPSKTKFDEGWFDTSFLTEEWFKNKLQEREELGKKDYSYMLNIFSKINGSSVGYCDITTHMREDFQYARIGYTIFNQFWQQGYAKEAIHAIVQIGFEDLNFHRLEAHINIDNDISKKVVLSAGFKFECIREKFIMEDGSWVDNEIYYILNNKYRL